MLPKLFVATKAFIVHEGRVLLLREAGKYQDGTNIGRYDVVGGRLTPGEHFRDSLLREIKEETDLAVTVGRPFFVNEWRPVVREEEWQIVGIFFRCDTHTAEVKLSEDHDTFEWIDPADFAKYNIIPNLTPAFESFLSLPNQ